MSPKPPKTEAPAPARPAPEEIPHLVRRALRLRLEIARRGKLLEQVNERLLTLEDGVYAGEKGGKCKVCHPSASIAPDEKAIAGAKKLLGDSFGLLFKEKQASLHPVKDFRIVATALLDQKLAKKVFALCEVPSKPYLQFS